MDPFVFLQLLPHEHVVTETGETVELFRLGTYEDGVFELACFMRQRYEPHVHDGVDSVIHVLCGSGTILLDNSARRYRSGDVFEVPAGMLHGFEVDEHTILFTRLSGPIKDPVTSVFDLRYPDTVAL